MADIEDGWGSGAGRFAGAGEDALVLRRTHAARAAQDERYLGFEGSRNTHRLKVRFDCGSAAGRTMGCEPKRIVIVHPLELHGAQLRQAFDVVAHLEQVVEAGEDVDEGFCAGGKMDLLPGRAEGNPGYLTSTRGDDGADAVFIRDDVRFEISAAVGITREPVQRGFGESIERELANQAAHGLEALTHAVVGEEVAQDDPEPFHALSIGSGFGPAESKRLRPTNRATRSLRLLEAVGSFPTDWGRLFPRFWAAVSTAGAARASLRDACRQAQDEAYWAVVWERLILSLSKDAARRA